MAEATKVKCSKCSSVDVHTRFRRAGESLLGYLDSRHEWHNKKAETGCLARNCRVCQYHWIDPVAPPMTKEFGHG